MLKNNNNTYTKFELQGFLYKVPFENIQEVKEALYYAGSDEAKQISIDLNQKVNRSQLELVILTVASFFEKPIE